MKSKFPLLLTLLALLTGCAASPAGDPSEDVQLSGENVVIYVRAGCPYCESALDILYGEGFRPVVRDVVRDRSAYRELQAIYLAEFPEEKVIVPVLVHEGRYLRGYHRQALLDFLAETPTIVAEEPEYCEDPVREAAGTPPALR